MSGTIQGVTREEAFDKLWAECIRAVQLGMTPKMAVALAKQAIIEANPHKGVWPEQLLRQWVDNHHGEGNDD